MFLNLRLKYLKNTSENEVIYKYFSSSLTPNKVKERKARKARKKMKAHNERKKMKTLKKMKACKACKK